MTTAIMEGFAGGFVLAFLALGVFLIVAYANGMSR